MYKMYIDSNRGKSASFFSLPARLYHPRLQLRPTCLKSKAATDLSKIARSVRCLQIFLQHKLSELVFATTHCFFAHGIHSYSNYFRSLPWPPKLSSCPSKFTASSRACARGSCKYMPSTVTKPLKSTFWMWSATRNSNRKYDMVLKNCVHIYIYIYAHPPPMNYLFCF